MATDLPRSVFANREIKVLTEGEVAAGAQIARTTFAPWITLAVMAAPTAAKLLANRTGSRRSPSVRFNQQSSRSS